MARLVSGDVKRRWTVGPAGGEELGPSTAPTQVAILAAGEVLALVEAIENRFW